MAIATSFAAGKKMWGLTTYTAQPSHQESCEAAAQEAMLVYKPRKKKKNTTSRSVTGSKTSNEAGDNRTILLPQMAAKVPELNYLVTSPSNTAAHCIPHPMHVQQFSLATFSCDQEEAQC